MHLDTRRIFVLASIAAFGFAAPGANAAPVPGGTLNPTTIPKSVDPLAIPPLMPTVAANAYDIAARQTVQQVLPATFPATKVWAYGSTNASASFNWPAATIEAQHGTAL